MRLYLRDEIHLYAKRLFDILIVYHKWYRFQFFSCGRGNVHSHPNRGSKWTHKSIKRHCFFAKKCSFWSFFSIDEGQLYASCLFYILTIYLKCLLFQFFSDAICMHILILTGVKNGHRSLWKQSYFAKKRPSRGFISEMNATCIPTFCLIFWLFILNDIFFSSIVVVYVGTFSS